MQIKTSKSKNIFWEKRSITLQEREKKLNYSFHTLWLTGLSGSGKSTISNSLERILFDKGFQVTRLDGDNIRHGINSDLGFSSEDRSENIRRIGHISKLFFQSGCIVICSFISPFRKDRNFVKNLFPPRHFHEIFLSCSIEKCMQRDPKSLYKKALAGEIQEFTGISSPYEEPESPNLILHTDKETIEQSTKKIFEYIIKKIQITN